MNWKALAVIFFVLFATGIAVRPIEGPAWEELASREPALQLDALEEAVGQGITVGLLGGFRAVVADLLWIRTNAVWAAQETAAIPATETMIRLVTTVDPRPVYFWLNGARMIAYDMPVWRIRDEGGEDVLPDAVTRRYFAEMGGRGIDLLQRAREFHPENADVLIEIASIYDRRVNDQEMAAEYYRKASELDEHPAYAPRIYAEILRRRLGRHEEAYEWLKQLYPTLDPANPTHMTPRVLSRIRELEDHLGVPQEERFQPGGSSG